VLHCDGEKGRWEVRDAIPRNDIGVAMMIEWHSMMDMNNEGCTIGSLELLG
jgi:hypothetical protein